VALFLHLRLQQRAALKRLSRYLFFVFLKYFFAKLFCFVSTFRFPSPSQLVLGLLQIVLENADYCFLEPLICSCALVPLSEIPAVLGICCVATVLFNTSCCAAPEYFATAVGSMFSGVC
jgi:hypothetical protein